MSTETLELAPYQTLDGLYLFTLTESARYSLSSPWLKDHVLYASNGVIGVRLTADDLVPEDFAAPLISADFDALSDVWEECGERWKADRLKLLSGADTKTDHPNFPNIAETFAVALKNGDPAWSQLMTSEECDTAGKSDHLGICHRCLGFGMIRWNDPVCRAEVCDICEGNIHLRGEMLELVNTAVLIGDKWFSRHLVERIRVFAPDAEIGVMGDHLHFRFEGGRGLLMRMEAT